MTTPAMPELLREIVAYCREAGHDWSNLNEAEHMLATLQAQPAEVSDEQIKAVMDAKAYHRHCCNSYWPFMFARAILALRPQAESEARRAAQEQLYTERERHTAEVKRLQAEIGRLQAERPQAVPMTPAERERELDRSPVDVSWEAGDAFMEGIYAAEAHHGITAQGAQGEQA